MSIMTKLREATRPRHTELEALPYVRALLDRSLPLESYVNELRAMAVVHGVVEREATAADDPRVQAVWTPDRTKLRLLRADEATFDGHGFPTRARATDAALSLTDAIRRRHASNPAALLGTLYVLEGATLGNQVHLADVAAAFHLDGVDGCRYYASYGDRVRERWETFAAAMEQALADPAVQPDVVEAAVETFSGFLHLYSVLFPLDDDAGPPHVTRINPEAGRHAIPDDDREIQAALRASAAAWSEFPYYLARFGERGRRFSDSDACWLATLTRLDSPVLQRQIDWLGLVLANRGMPTLLLERSLRHLHRELSAAAPENQPLYDRLLGAAAHLATARIRRISDESAVPLVREFERTVHASLLDAYPHTATLLIAAVADECNGIEQAVPALLDWAADPDRFPAPWIAAVHRVVNQARQQAR